MYELTQVYIIMLSITFYVVVGAIIAIPIMAIVTYVKGDKAYFRKKIDKLIGGNNG